MEKIQQQLLDVDAKAVGAVQLFWLLTRTTAAWTAKF
jgi:hypothetical protein